MTSFCRGFKLAVIDITLGGFIRALLIGSQNIMFNLQGSIPVHLIRNPGHQLGLRGRLERGTEMNLKDEAGLGLPIRWV